MKLTIAHSKTKRRLEGTFRLCGSREDLAHLVEQLEVALADRSWHFSWVTIRPRSEEIQDMANTPPIGWDAP